MSNKKPQTRVVNVPADFLPWIEEERDRQGCFTTADCMGKILEKYFGKRPHIEGSEPATISENGRKPAAGTMVGVKKGG